jgi:cytochrome c-type biogenesis protein
MQEGTLLFAFFAGMISFLSPCVLPIIPGYLSYLAGTARPKDKENIPPSRKDIFVTSIFFVLGFSTIFSLLGVLLNTLFEAFAYDVQVWLGRVGGIIIIFFGLYLMGLLKIGFLQREHRLKVKKTFGSRNLTAFIFGAAFAVGWSPCVGAVLGGILALAATQPGIAFALLISYSLGFGIPFLLVGLFTAQASKLISKFGKWLKVLDIIFGIVLLVLGVLIFTQTLSQYASFELLNNLLY